MATYCHTTDLLGQRLREFWWTEKFAVKGKIVEAPSDWLDQNLKNLASANDGWTIFPQPMTHPTYNFPTGEIKIPEWDHSLAIGKYVWFDSQPVTPAPGWLKGCDGPAYHITIPEGVVIAAAGVKHAGGVYISQSDE